jgi:hypothetical protein
MAYVFWDANGNTHTEFMPWGTTIKANAYCDNCMRLFAGRDLYICLKT